MNTEVMSLAVSVWSETALAVLPIMVVFGLGNRLISMLVRAVEGRNIEI